MKNFLNCLKKNLILKIFNTFTNILPIAISLILFSCSSNNKLIPKKEYNYDVTIYRDTWGVPHVYGKCDEDAAFGLAVAHAEEEFEAIQDVLIETRG